MQTTKSALIKLILCATISQSFEFQATVGFRGSPLRPSRVVNVVNHYCTLNLKVNMISDSNNDQPRIEKIASSMTTSSEVNHDVWKNRFLVSKVGDRIPDPICNSVKCCLERLFQNIEDNNYSNSLNFYLAINNTDPLFGRVIRGQTKKTMGIQRPHQHHPSEFSIQQRFKEELKHFENEIFRYWDGLKLLVWDIRTCVNILEDIASGKMVSPYQHQKLKSTGIDILKLLPFIVIVIVPFMEFALPALLILFPDMMPSTFQRKSSDKITSPSHAGEILDLLERRLDGLEQEDWLSVRQLAASQQPPLVPAAFPDDVRAEKSTE